MTAASRWGWLDFDAAESQQVRDFLSQDREGEGNDPLRLGFTVRDRISERLFPGTSTQHTRLRYAVLTPAVLRKPLTTLGRLTQTQSGLNRRLHLANPGERGIIGKRKPERDFVHRYWTAVRGWGLLRPVTGDDRDITVANGLAALQSTVQTDEEGNALTDLRVRWDPELVRLADEFLEADRHGAAPSIHCRPAEADYLVARWVDLPDQPALAAIAEQVRRGRPQSVAVWPWAVDIPGHPAAREQLDRARTVSLVCWSAQIAYNLALLSAARTLESAGVTTTWQLRQQSLDRTEATIQDLYGRWRTAFAAEQPGLEDWSQPSQWRDLGSDRSRDFLAATTGRLVSGDTDLASRHWAAWVRQREEHANPAPKLGSDAHLGRWSGTAEMAYRWDYRWGAVRRLVADAEDPRG